VARGVCAAWTIGEHAEKQEINVSRVGIKAREKRGIRRKEIQWRASGVVETAKGRGGKGDCTT